LRTVQRHIASAGSGTLAAVPRRYPKFAEMNDGYTGQRFERTEYVLAKGPDERYQEVWDLQKVATVGIPNKSIPR
jgi:hypothetical protein